jgi:hypothetical protein
MDSRLLFLKFVVGVRKTSERQSWQGVALLQQDGMIIESHIMTHAHLNSVPTSKLCYELGFAMIRLVHVETRSRQDIAFRFFFSTSSSPSLPLLSDEK